jgi:hypothetical protein
MLICGHVINLDFATNKNSREFLLILLKLNSTAYFFFVARGNIIFEESIYSIYSSHKIITWVNSITGLTINKSIDCIM